MSGVQDWLVGQRGQALAAGVTLLGLAVIGLGVIQPLWSWYDGRQDLLVQRQALLAHMQGVADALPALQDAANKVQPDTDTVSALLPGASDAVAAADLQERVQKLAAASGLSLTVVETLPSEPNPGRWHKVALRISLAAPWPVLTGLMRTIEQSPTRIFIDDVHFHSPIVAPHTPPQPIEASMVLYGFRAADPAAAS